MALDKFERANLNRLLKCVAPNQRRIDRIKKKVREDAEKAFATIEELKRQNEGFQELIDELRAKENAPEEEEPQDLEAVEEAIVPNIEEAEEEEDEPQSDFPPTLMEEPEDEEEGQEDDYSNPFNI